MGKKYRFTAYPYASQNCSIEAPDDAVVDDNYIRDHWGEVQFNEPSLDYCGTDIGDIEEE